MAVCLGQELAWVHGVLNFWVSASSEPRGQAFLDIKVCRGGGG